MDQPIGYHTAPGRSFGPFGEVIEIDTMAGQDGGLNLGQIFRCGDDNRTCGDT